MELQGIVFDSFNLRRPGKRTFANDETPAVAFQFCGLMLWVYMSFNLFQLIERHDEDGWRSAFVVDVDVHETCCEPVKLLLELGVE